MKNLRRGSGLVLGLLWVLIADLATAGDYVLLVGKGFEVCEAYLKNLNSFPKHPPMVCDRPLNPKLTEFSKPQWQPLAVWPNRHLLREALRNKPFNLKYSDEEFNQANPYIQWEANLKAGMAAQTMTFGLASLDVDRDGTPETVLRFDAGFSCDPADEYTYRSPGGIEFYVLSADQRHLDSWRSGNFGILGGREEIILYQGNVYITSWGGGQLRLQTPLHVRGMDTEVCDYTYQPSHPRRRS
ncbi:MAG: hypothetical protein OEY28_12425 [Nitrospira sp.]|nr:hypothetical protein [Nitrospira sp.]